MADIPGQFTLLYDQNGQPVSTAWAPVTGRPGTATYSPQGGLMLLGHNYGTSAAAGTAYAPKVDAQGNLYTSSPDQVQAGTAVASVNSVVGGVLLALQGLTPTAAQMDGLTNIYAAPYSSPTFSVIATAVTLSSAKSMLAVVNKSTSSIIRLLSIQAQNTAVAPSVLSSYFIYAEQAHFITGASGGTTLTPISFDSADSLPTGITCYTGATVTGETTTPIKRWITSNYPLAPGGTAAEDTTFDQQGRDQWLNRLDPSAKTITIRPGAGLHVRPAATGNNLTNGAQDVTFIFTVSPA